MRVTGYNTIHQPAVITYQRLSFCTTQTGREHRQTRVMKTHRGSGKDSHIVRFTLPAEQPWPLHRPAWTPTWHSRQSSARQPAAQRLERILTICLSNRSMCNSNLSMCSSSSVLLTSYDVHRGRAKHLRVADFRRARPCSLGYRSLRKPEQTQHMHASANRSGRKMTYSDTGPP